MSWWCKLFHGWCAHGATCPSIDAIMRRFTVLEEKGEQIMATLAELQAKIEAINITIDEERTQVQGLLVGLRAQIQALQDQIAAGSLVSQAQLDALAASADAIVARVRDISEPAV